MTFTSAIYEGVVTHARFGPRPHRLAYRIFMFLLDLDEAPALDRALRLFSVGRFNLVGFNPRRHGDGSKVPLKAQVEARGKAFFMKQMARKAPIPSELMVRDFPPALAA